MAREKVAVGETETATPVAPSSGVVAVTVGAAAVVKLQLTGAASAAPAEEVAVVATWTVYVVEGSRAAAGSMVTRRVVALYETVASTGEPPDGRSVTEALSRVAAFMPREKVAVGDASGATPVAPSAGVVDTTVGTGAGAVGVGSATTRSTR